jgi:hypothetical protein
MNRIREENVFLDQNTQKTLVETKDKKEFYPKDPILCKLNSENIAKSAVGLHVSNKSLS